MKRLLLGLLLLASASRAVDTLSIPTNYLTVTTGTRATLAGNFTAIETWGNKVRDSIAQVTAHLGGYSGNLAITSLSNLRLKLDGDNSETARLLVESGNGDSLFTVKEDSTAKFYGNLTVNGTATITGGITNAPTFSSGFTSAGGSFVEYSNPGGTSNLRIGNTSTAASSDARLNLQVNGAAAGDPFIRWDVSGVTSWSAGADNSVAGDPFVIAASGTLGSSNAVSITTAGNMAVTGSVTGASLVATGNLTADSIVSSKFYEEGSFTGTLTGCTTSPTGTVKYVRVGKQVTIRIPSITGTSNANGMTITGLPAALYPPTDIHLSTIQKASCMDNGVQQDNCSIILTSTGIIKYTGPGSGTYTSFTSSGTKGTSDAYGALYNYTYTLQ